MYDNKFVQFYTHTTKNFKVYTAYDIPMGKMLFSPPPPKEAFYNPNDDTLCLHNQITLFLSGSWKAECKAMPEKEKILGKAEGTFMQLPWRAKAAYKLTTMDELNSMVCFMPINEGAYPTNLNDFWQRELIILNEGDNFEFGPYEEENNFWIAKGKINIDNQLERSADTMLTLSVNETMKVMILEDDTFLLRLWKGVSLKEL